MLQESFCLPVGTYRLGIVLLSDDTLSEQKLDSVLLSDDCTSDEIHDTSLLGKSLLNIYYPVHGHMLTVNPRVQHWLFSENFTDKEIEEDTRGSFGIVSTFCCQPHSSFSVSVLPVHAPTTSSHSVNSPLSPSITPSLFHSRLKTYLFHKSFPP